MKDGQVSFGYNTSKDNSEYVAWEAIGTKYNFNLQGIPLGIFMSDDKDYLLSQVTFSAGDNCMAGTIDAREVLLIPESDNSILISNSELSAESVKISAVLSTKEVKEKLALGTSIEKTDSFGHLKESGIEMVRENVELPLDITVCGVESEKFKYLKEKNHGKTR